MRPTDIGRLVSVGEPAVSPDGRTVAFVVNRVDLDANRYRGSVWLAAVDGSTPPYRFSAGEHGDGHPAWSPDGRFLAFTSRRADKHDGERPSTLHLAPVGGPGEVVTLARQPEAIGAPRWSPDGTCIAFAARQRTERWEQGDDDDARPPRRIDRLLDRLDDEGSIIDRPTQVWVVAVDGSGPAVAVTSGIHEHGAPAWSPDGTRLAFTAGRHADWDVGRPVDDLYVLDIGTDGPGEPGEPAEPEQLTDDWYSHRAPAWSPDGTRIATLAEQVRVAPRHPQLSVVDIASGDRVEPLRPRDRNCAPFPGARAPVWDGIDHLLTSIEDHGRVTLLRIPADRSADPEVVAGGDRAVRGFDAAGGTVAFVATTFTELPELFVAGRNGSGEWRLTDLGRPFHRAVPSQPAERFTVPSPAGDGDVDAWLVLPPDHDGSSPLPVLLNIHGGPHTQYGESWFDEFQLYVSAGYAVLASNPHGSSDQGEAWMRELRSPKSADDPGTGWGGVDFDDVMAVLDAALARSPFLDGDRVGVLGGSYGGYLTTWAIGHSDRFAAACAERSASDLLALEGCSDAAGLFRWQLGVSHLDHPDEYARMSPITCVRSIDTPLLILHSEGDLRCPVAMADQLYVNLRLLGKEVEYYRFPGESHELSRSGSPRHRVQRAELILDFFGRHLKPSPSSGSTPTTAR